MVVWEPERQTTRVRNGEVTAVSPDGGYVSVAVDAGAKVINNVPVYGRVGHGDGVLLLEQGGSLLALGVAFLPLAGGRMTGILRTVGGTDCLEINGTGIAYSGTTHPGGSSNRIGFRWGSPNILGAVDNVVTAVVGVVSTGRLKSNVRAVGGALDTVLRLRPVTYDPLQVDGSPLEDPERHIGLIAEEVAGVVPSAVVRTDDGEVASVNYFELVSLLVAAVQELAVGVAAMEARLRDG